MIRLVKLLKFNVFFYLLYLQEKTTTKAGRNIPEIRQIIHLEMVLRFFEINFFISAKSMNFQVSISNFKARLSVSDFFYEFSVSNISTDLRTGKLSLDGIAAYHQNSGSQTCSSRYPNQVCDYVYTTHNILRCKKNATSMLLSLITFLSPENRVLPSGVIYSHIANHCTRSTEVSFSTASDILFQFLQNLHIL